MSDTVNAKLLDVTKVVCNDCACRDICGLVRISIRIFNLSSSWFSQLCLYPLLILSGYWVNVRCLLRYCFSYSDHGIINEHIVVLKTDGEVYAERLSISSLLDKDCKLLHYVAIFSDITRSKEQQDALMLMAHYDVLTQLPNRILLADRFIQAIAHSKRKKLWLPYVFLIWIISNLLMINSDCRRCWNIRTWFNVTVNGLQRSTSIAWVLSPRLHGWWDEPWVIIDIIMYYYWRYQVKEGPI